MKNGIKQNSKSDDVMSGVNKTFSASTHTHTRSKQILSYLIFLFLTVKYPPQIIQQQQPIHRRSVGKIRKKKKLLYKISIQ